MPFRNFTIGDVTRRRGKERLTDKTFYDLAEQFKGQYQAYAMFLAYGEAFQEHYAKQELNDKGQISKPAYSVKGWSGDEPAFFTDIPVDFDASDGIQHAYNQARSFVDSELIGRGIDHRYFVVYLSGGKGFHIHISASVFNIIQPVPNAGFRFKQLAHNWKQKYDRIDLSIYNSTALFRLPGSRHKSGLYKTEIPLELFTLEHVNNAEEWASAAPENIRIPEQGSPPVLIDLPEVHLPTARTAYDFNDFDESAEVLPNCPWLRNVMENPTNDGKDGDGREKRRNAIGILLSGAETSEANPELHYFIQRIEQNDYMDEQRMEDVFKWVREYDRDGEIKCKKLCHSIGCGAGQRSRCGTMSPLDWKLKKEDLNVRSVEENRETLRGTINQILDSPVKGINVTEIAVGLGKTFTFMEEMQTRKMTCFYLAPTHALAEQTAIALEDRGIKTRHVMSRVFLTDHYGFECNFPREVSLAIYNGLGAHTVCAKCPRKKKFNQDAKVYSCEAGYDPCEYFEQFEDLDKITAVVGVHNHLFEHMYDVAGVNERSITLLDESPLEALSYTIPAIDPTKLELLKIEAARVINAEKAPALADTKQRTGIFARVAAVLAAQVHQAQTTDSHHKIQIWQAFNAILNGLPADMQLLGSLGHDVIRGFWYEFAGRIAVNLGWPDEAGIAPDQAYLTVPYPINHAFELAQKDEVYDPGYDFFLPARLPQNKILILDATASYDVYAEVFRYLTKGQEAREFKYFQMPFTEQAYSHTVQITSSSYGVSKLFEETTQSKLSYAITQLLKKYPGPSLVVCHKAHAEFWRSELRNFKQVEIATFGSLKGINRWESFANQFIVGTPFVPDYGIADLAWKLGQPVSALKLSESAALKTVMMKARNQDTAVIHRRVYDGFPFHTALAQTKSQWEVTQAVRLRLYDKKTDGVQRLYIFSNVELKGMYADQFMKLDELNASFSSIVENEEEYAKAKAEGKRTRSGFTSLDRWFEALPQGFQFKRSELPDVVSDTSAKTWLAALVEAGLIDRTGMARSTAYIKL